MLFLFLLLLLLLMHHIATHNISLGSYNDDFKVLDIKPLVPLFIKKYANSLTNNSHMKVLIGNLNSIFVDLLNFCVICVKRWKKNCARHKKISRLLKISQLNYESTTCERLWNNFGMNVIKKRFKVLWKADAKKTQSYFFGPLPISHIM